MQAADQISHDVSYLDYKGKYKGIFAWIFATDHKRIALLYLFSMMTMFVVGVLLGLAMKLELIAPGRTIMDPQSYNAVFTVHGVIMIFMIVIPGLPAVLGNFMLPIMIGAKDVAFPKVNLLSWYFYVAGAILVVDWLIFVYGKSVT
jgi:cytochrome c oxidase subunit 1